MPGNIPPFPANIQSLSDIIQALNGELKLASNAKEDVAVQGIHLRKLLQLSIWALTFNNLVKEQPTQLQNVILRNCIKVINFDFLLQIATLQNIPLAYSLSRSAICKVIETKEQLQKILDANPKFFSVPPYEGFIKLNERCDQHIIKLVIQICSMPQFSFDKLLDYFRYPDFGVELSKNPDIQKLVSTPEQLQRVTKVNLAAAKELAKALHLVDAKLDEKKGPTTEASLSVPLAHTRERFFKKGVPHARHKRRLSLGSSRMVHPPETKSAKKFMLEQNEFKQRQDFHKQKREQQRKKFITENLMSVKDYIFQMNFGPSGYYRNEVSFDSDFETAASGHRHPFTGHKMEPKALANALVFQMYELWIKQGKPATFSVVECGAGNGQLCAAIMKIISTYEGCKGDLEKFYHAFQYNIVEISDKLTEMQQKATERFHGKVRVIEGSATMLDQSQKLRSEFKQPVSMVFSNELVDMFPPHQIKLDKQRNVRVGMAVPMVTKKELSEYFKLQPQSVAHLEEKSQQLKKFLAEQGPKTDDVILLSREDYLDLHKTYTANEKKQEYAADKFTFHEYFVDSRYFPEVQSLLQACPEFLARMEPESVRYLNVNMLDYMRGVCSLLREDGEVISIDYGHNDSLASDAEMRTFSRLPMAHSDNMYVRPGLMDITMDVNFSLLDRIGNQFGMRHLFFGPQGALWPSDSQRLDEGYFVLVQTKTAPKLSNEQFQAQQAAAKHRFEGASLPVSYKDIFLQEFSKDQDAFIKLQFAQGNYLAVTSAQQNVLHCMVLETFKDEHTISFDELMPELTRLDKKTLKALCEQQDKDGNTPLHLLTKKVGWNGFRTLCDHFQKLYALCEFSASSLNHAGESPLMVLLSSCGIFDSSKIADAVTTLVKDMNAEVSQSSCELAEKLHRPYHFRESDDKWRQDWRSTVSLLRRMMPSAENKQARP